MRLNNAYPHKSWQNAYPYKSWHNTYPHKPQLLLVYTLLQNDSGMKEGEAVIVFTFAVASSLAVAKRAYWPLLLAVVKSNL
jgi:hypothetical protein